MFAIVVVPRTQQPLKPTRRRLQWSVRGLLLLTTLCAIGATLFLSPRIREREAIDWLETKGASFETEPIGPDWLRERIGDRYLQHVVVADLISCEISDADLIRLAPMHRLRELKLAYTEVTIGCVEQMSKQWRDISVDVLLADTLYSAAGAEARAHYAPFYETIVECQAAVQWKTGWADSRGGRRERLAARRQFIDTLNTCAGAYQQGGKSMTPLERAMLEAALAEGRIELAKVSKSESGLADALRSGEAVGKMLVRCLDDAVMDMISPFEFDAARELATRLLLASRTGGGETADAVQVLTDECKQMELLTGRVQRLYRERKRGGEGEKMALCKVDLALVRGRLALARGDRAAAVRVLQTELENAALLREVAGAAYKAGIGTLFNFVTANRRAAELDIELAQAQDDRQAEQNVRDQWLAYLGEQLQRAVWGEVVDAFPDTSHKYLVFCYYALAQYDQKGTNLFDQPVAVLAPPAPIISESTAYEETLDDPEMSSDETELLLPGDPLDEPEMSSHETELLPPENPLD